MRPTAFFKSLSGQVERVRADLAEYLADCLEREDLQNRILPIGGPGPAITPAEQGARLAELTGQPVRLRRVPVAVLDAVIAGLSIAGKVSRRARDKAALARIGRYYATESMLVLDPETGRYDAEATPETGQDRLFDYYAQLVSGEETAERGDHAVF